MAAQLESQLNRAKGSALTFSFTSRIAAAAKRCQEIVCASTSPSPMLTESSPTSSSLKRSLAVEAQHAHENIRSSGVDTLSERRRGNLDPPSWCGRLCVFDLSVTLACAECLTASQSAPNGSYGPYGHITSMGNA